MNHDSRPGLHPNVCILLIHQSTLKSEHQVIFIFPVLTKIQFVPKKQRLKLAELPPDMCIIEEDVGKNMQIFAFPYLSPRTGSQLHPNSSI